MLRRPPRSTRTDTPFPTRRSSDLPTESLIGDFRELKYFFSGLVISSSIQLLVFFSLMVRDFNEIQTESHAVKRMETYIQKRSEAHTSELQSLMRISYAVFCLKKQKTNLPNTTETNTQQKNT